MGEQNPLLRRMTVEEFDWLSDRTFALAERLGIEVSDETAGQIGSIQFELLHVFCSGAGIEVASFGRLNLAPRKPPTEGGGA